MHQVAIISVHGCPIARLGETDTGGMNVYVRHLARCLGDQGIRVDVFTRRHDPADPQVVELGANVRLIHIDAGPLDEPKYDIFPHLSIFLERLEAFRRSEGIEYDLLHTHYWLSGYVGTRLSHLWKVPHVVSFHTLAYLKRLAHVGERESILRVENERMVVRHADQVIASSQNEKDALVRHYGASATKVSVIPCGVDINLFRPIDREIARDHTNLDKHRRYLLYVGRVEPLKGIDLLIEGMLRLRSHYDAQLLILGGNKSVDEQREKLLTRVRHLGLGKNVQFLGPMPQEVLPDYYCAADVCLVPSYYESFSLVALEAMACGSPVVATRVGGLQSVVQDGRTGYLVPWRCSDPFVDRVEILLLNESLRQAMGRAGRALAITNGWQVVGQRVTELYAQILRSRKLAAAS
jgi:D-inositol-3-phosphate glycosyltransferase